MFFLSFFLNSTLCLSIPCSDHLFLLSFELWTSLSVLSLHPVFLVSVTCSVVIHGCIILKAPNMLDMTFYPLHRSTSRWLPQLIDKSSIYIFKLIISWASKTKEKKIGDRRNKKRKRRITCSSPNGKSPVP